MSTATRSRACFESVEVCQPLLIAPLKEKKKLTVSGEEGDCCSGGTGAASSANAMHVVFGVIGIVIVQHMSDIANVFTNRLANRERTKKSKAIVLLIA